jgi:hypothetical protein
MTTKIKGAIEVYICKSLDDVPEVYDIYQTDLGTNGIALKYKDLEAYAQERERKAWEAGQQYTKIEQGWLSGSVNQKCITHTEIEFKYKTLEDFKKENHE